MDEKRQFEVLLVRLVPHALRDDFMTVGVVVVEDRRRASSDSPEQGGQECPPHTSGGRFADFRITRDWKRIACFAPDFEMEVMEQLGRVMREGIGEMIEPVAEPGSARERLLKLLDDNFGSIFDVGPVKAMVAQDPVAEMRVLERDYLAPAGAGSTAERARRIGRIGIVSRMQDAFAAAGVLEMLGRDLDMREFTGENDPFRVDFGFRVGRTLKMFQALALGLSREPAITLAYRYGRIRSGMRARDEEAMMTAILSEEAMRARGEAASGIAMLRENEIAVREVGDMGEIAEEVRREIRLIQ